MASVPTLDLTTSLRGDFILCFSCSSSVYSLSEVGGFETLSLGLGLVFPFAFARGCGLGASSP